MGRIRVDVLVTFYNQEQYVDDALHSVFMQEGNFDLRVLIGDDGSSDRTPVLLREWQRRFPQQIQIVRTERTKGQMQPGGFRASKNRLNLLRKVDADYFIFLDGDDYFDDSYKLHKQISELQKQENEDCIACGHDIDALYKDGSRKPFAFVPGGKQKFDLREYWPYVYLHTDTILFRQKAISDLPYSLIENNFNDNAITFLFLRSGKILYFPEAMAVYRQTDDGIWTGESEIISRIREMILFDIAYQIAPELRSETRSRFAHSWLRLYQLRREIDSQKLKAYDEEAAEKGFSFTRQWIHFNDIHCHGNIKLFSAFLMVIVSRILFKVKHFIRNSRT